jgi:UDP-N-acetylglucosamine transferase subunit ALG13
VILATVGTHEQPMDRLFEALDRLVATGVLTEPVVAQVGHSAYSSTRFPTHRMLAFDVLQEHLRAARIIISHGGPATIMQAFAVGKVPVVVPRQSRFGEHIDDHQVRFASRIADRALVVLDVATLGDVLTRYDALVAGLSGEPPGAGRAAAFAARLDEVCEDLLRP